MESVKLEAEIIYAIQLLWESEDNGSSDQKCTSRVLGYNMPLTRCPTHPLLGVTKCPISWQLMALERLPPSITLL